SQRRVRQPGLARPHRDAERSDQILTQLSKLRADIQDLHSKQPLACFLSCANVIGWFALATLFVYYSQTAALLSHGKDQHPLVEGWLAIFTGIFIHLDSVVALFAASFEQRATAQLNTLKQQLGTATVPG
ncbi:MAG: hypothetical protein ACR2PL_11990, partial [Dehalococcoidia bacterium]